jgi:glycosyltransferase involved in cell wall biosynthesis
MSVQIITAVKNPGKELLDTAASIRQQTLNDWRWYIANGGEICDELNTIFDFNDSRITVCSKSDAGIYDAWNAACSRSKADWTIFLGSGDKLADQTVLERANEHLKLIDPTIPRIAFGGCRLISHVSGHELRIQNNEWEKMKNKFKYGKPCLPIHPETFHSSGLLVGSEIFNTAFKVAGDVDVMLRALGRSQPILLPFIVSDVITGGVSQDPRAGFRIYKEVLLACAANKVDVPIYIKMKEYTRSAIKYMLWYLFGSGGYLIVKEILLREIRIRIKGVRN